MIGIIEEEELEDEGTDNEDEKDEEEWSQLRAHTPKRSPL